MSTPRATRIGVLYPAHAAEDDYPRIASMLAVPADVVVIHTASDDQHQEDVLRSTGDLLRLLAGAARLRDSLIDVAVWACTSGSFVFGLEGAKTQARAIADYLGVPASSTTLAFLNAIDHLGLDRISIAATYPPSVTQMFVGLLAQHGVDIVSQTSSSIFTGAEVGLLTAPTIDDLLLAADHPKAQALLVPDTALHTVAHLDHFEDLLGKPVLTANQVTFWEALRLTKADTTGFGLGMLMRATQSDGRPDRH